MGQPGRKGHRHDPPDLARAADRSIAFGSSIGPNQQDQITSSMLVFSDGTTIPVGPLPNDAKKGIEVKFEPEDRQMAGADRYRRQPDDAKRRPVGDRRVPRCEMTRRWLGAFPSILTQGDLTGACALFRASSCTEVGPFCRQNVLGCGAAARGCATRILKQLLAVALVVVSAGAGFRSPAARIESANKELQSDY